MNTKMIPVTGQLCRLKETDRETVQFYLDGQLVNALAGDTVLTAMLSNGKQLRRNEFSHLPRAGFCMMGACQDCWVTLESGEKVRACSTFIAPDMRLLSSLPGDQQ